MIWTHNFALIDNFMMIHASLLLPFTSIWFSCILSGGGRRETSIVVITLDSGETYIIASISSRGDTQVIYVDPTTGKLRYTGKLGVDIFSTEEEAINYVTNGSKWLCRSTTYAKAILGYAALGCFGMVLVATKLTASIPNLPGGGCIYTVAESQWIKISLQNPQPQGKGEIRNIQELTELDIDGKHYFCETRDITRPFPSRFPLHKPDDEFVWNGWLSTPFKTIGLPKHCVILLQVLFHTWYLLKSSSICQKILPNVAYTEKAETTAITSACYFLLYACSCIV